MTDSLRILIVEDDRNLRASMSRYLEDEGLATTGVATAEEALQAIETSTFDVALVDYRLPGMDGIALVAELGTRAPATPCLVMTAHGDVQAAVAAMKAGAFHFLEKPVDPASLVELIRKAAEKEQLRREVERLRQAVDERYGFEKIVGNSAPMRKVFERIKLAAPTHSTILITGETGTGKELVARAIHVNSTRRDRPFVAVNCSALPETLIESELFGHEKGAFTGAATAKRGYFEAADGGTLFIDEVGEMAPALQAKLLRALEQKVVTRVGSTLEIPVDVRILAATNRPLEADVAAGKFRSDLYYRLSVVTIDLPPLRRRREDIPLLTATFLRELAREHGREPMQVTEAALDVLEHYPWPGNVRELRNVLESIVVLSTGDTLDVNDLPAHVLRGETPEEMAESTTETASTTPREASAGDAAAAGKTLAEIEKEAILAAIDAHGGNKTKAAQSLGIAVRTIQRKLAQYGEEGGA
jgi:DNA-binding NtrC family response regulator